MSLYNLFIELAKPDEEGISRIVTRKEFVDKYKPLYHKNGCSWGRSDGNLCKKYRLLRINQKGTITNYSEDIPDELSQEIKLKLSEVKGNGIVMYKLYGLNNDTSTNYIRTDIINKIKGMNCLVLGTSTPEVDHKNGRKNNKKVMNTKTQEVTDFQPLSKAANDAKRQHCKKCKETNIRYDAKNLKYSKSFTVGTLNYETDTGCTGCYWYDIEDFKSKIE